MRVRATVAAAFVVLASIQVGHPAVATAPHRVDGRIDDWHGATTELGGTWQVSSGELVYQDHLFDDLGPNTNRRGQQHGTVENPKGDYRYPTDEGRYGYNAADLQELRLAADDDNLWLLARMSTLKANDSTVVSVGLDTDSDATEASDWPYQAGIKVPGVDTVVTMWGAGGSVTDLASGRTTDLDDVAADTDNANNAIEARVPRSFVPASGTVKVWAVTGLWDPAAKTFMAVADSPTTTTPGGGSPLVTTRVWNVAFRENEAGMFMEDNQAEALQSGNIAAYHAEIKIDDLVRGIDDPYDFTTGRVYAVIIDTGFSIPPLNEGVSYAGVSGRFQGVGGQALTQKFEFLGRYQPYCVYVPKAHNGTTVLPGALALHGIGGSHSTYATRPGFESDMGEGDLNEDGTPDVASMYVITPLARGASFYADYGEADTLAALADAERRFPIDRDRLYLTGYSMGGYGVYRLASLYPDLFAAAVVWAGYSGEFVGSYTTNPLNQVTGGDGHTGKTNIGDPVDTLENLRNLPLVHLSGTNDEIVPTVGQYAAPRRLAELGYRSRWDVYPGYEHLTFALVDDWKQPRMWLERFPTRASRPRVVDYRFSDGWTAKGLAQTLGLDHGNAWWVRDLEMRDHTEDGLKLASAHLESWRIADKAHTAKTSTTPAALPTPHVQQLVSWTDGNALDIANRLNLNLTGVGSVTVDLADAALDGCGLEMNVVTDGKVTIRLHHRFLRPVSVSGIVGATVQRAPGSLDAVVTVPGSGRALVGC